MALPLHKIFASFTENSRNHQMQRQVGSVRMYNNSSKVSATISLQERTVGLCCVVISQRKLLRILTTLVSIVTWACKVT